MSFENQLGSVVARLAQAEKRVETIELDLAIEKKNLEQMRDEIKLIQSELRPKP